MRKNVAVLLALIFLIVAGVLSIQPTKALSGTIRVTNVNQLINAIYGATDGDVIFVMKGTYETPQDQTLVITKAISLVGEDPDNTIIKLHPAWEQQGWNYLIPVYDFNNPIEIQASDVEISGLTVSSDGGSILATGSRIHMWNNRITTQLLANGRYQNISQNIITGGIGCYDSYNNIEGNSIIGRGIIVGGGSNEIHGNNITDCNTETAGCGIRLDGGGHTVFNNIIKNCNHAVSILGGSSSNNIYANTVIKNVGGLEIFGQGSNNVFHDNYAANNRYGVLLSYTYLMSPGENNTVYHNNFVNNTEQINNDSTYYGNYGSEASIYPTGNYDNGKEGNYWSDYAGTDANNDGIGDSPYVVASKKDRYPLMYPWGAPDVSMCSLENATYPGSISLSFTVNKPTSWMGYSLDGLDNVTITGNTTITDISSGLHNITVCANDVYGIGGASETSYFTVTSEAETETFPTIIVVATVATVAVLSVGLLLYFKKRSR